MCFDSENVDHDDDRDNVDLEDDEEETGSIHWICLKDNSKTGNISCGWSSHWDNFKPIWYSIGDDNDRCDIDNSDNICAGSIIILLQKYSKNGDYVFQDSLDMNILNFDKAIF